MTTTTPDLTTTPTDRREPALRVVLLVGSVRAGRLADALLPWLTRRLQETDWLDLDVVDLKDADLSVAMDGASQVSERLAAADAFVVLTPEYNHGYPAALKLAIDSHRDEWVRKPAGFVSYGAGSGGLRAVEQLRQVFCELQSMTTRNAVAIGAPWDDLDESGVFTASAHAEGALSATLEELHWWARVLHEARRADAVR